MSAQIAQVPDFLPAQADPSQRQIVERAHVLARQPLVRKQSYQSAEDRGGRLPRELLTDEGCNEGGEMVLTLALTETARANSSNRCTQDGIAAHEEPLRPHIVVRRQRSRNGCFTGRP